MLSRSVKGGKVFWSSFYQEIYELFPNCRITYLGLRYVGKKNCQRKKMYAWRSSLFDIKLSYISKVICVPMPSIKWWIHGITGLRRIMHFSKIDLILSLFKYWTSLTSFFEVQWSQALLTDLSDEDVTWFNQKLDHQTIMV